MMIRNQPQLALLALALATPAMAAPVPASIPVAAAPLTQDEQPLSGEELGKHLRTQFAKAKLMTDELGKLAEADEALLGLGSLLLDAVSTGEAPKDAQAIFTDIVALHTRVLRLKGEDERALRSLQRLFDSLVRPDGMTEEMYAFLEGIPQDSPLRKELIELLALSKGESEGQPKTVRIGQSIDEQVAMAASSGRTDFVLQIGARAVDGLLSVLQFGNHILL